jgi:arylsulfatase
VQHLKDTGQYENTVFALYSDNGGESSNVSMIPGSPQRDYIMSHYHTPEDPNFDPNNYQNMGDASWVVSPNPEWAMLMNTPFNRHKVNLFDGGFHVPAIIHYPQAKVSGVKYDCMQSVMDFVPTLLDTAQVTYPTTWNGKPLAPLQGQSMRGLFNGNFSCNADRVLATEFDGMKGVRHAGWALSQGRFDDTWYLFNLEQDPFESRDLRALYPDKFAELVGYYQQYVKENRVYEVSAKYLLPLVDNSASASITGGTSVNGMVPWQIQATAKTSDYVDLSAFVRVAPEDVGKTGELFAYGRFTPAAGGQPMYFDMSENRISFRPDINGLRTLAPKPLPTSAPFTLYQGKVTFPGKVEIMAGYRVGSQMVYNTELVTLTVTAD